MTIKVKRMVYDLVGKRPVARFYYQGNHSHPVRRTVLIIEETQDSLTGYILREGSVRRTPQEALSHIKTFTKSKIARWGDYSRLRMSSKTIFKNPRRTTLERFPLVSLFVNGV